MRQRLNGSRRASRRDRSIAALLAGTLAFAMLAGIVIGLSVGFERVPQVAMQAFDVIVPPPPEVKPKLSRQPAGKAAPPAKRAIPKPVSAPTPSAKQSDPVPPVAGPGAEARAGASEQPEAGAGGGGTGTGLGSGGSGDGGGGAVAVHAKHVSGSIGNRDYPNSAAKAGVRGSVTITLTIGANGRVTDCRVARSSGNSDLDAVTCRLARARFRYTPARDSTGKLIEDVAGWRQDWWLEGQARPAG